MTPIAQTKLRTSVVKPNRNISFPFGTILTVDEYFEKLGFPNVFSKHKARGISINSLVKALLSYKLTENFSISRASDWINRKEVLRMFELKPFEQRTLFRVFETLGENHERIIYDIQDCLLKRYNFEHTDINMDWTSLILYGDKCPLGKYGYSRDHRPDKKQITVGLTELASPINVPIGMTVKEGNVPDVVHFDDTYEQVKDILKEGSRIIFDKGAHSYENVENILLDGMKYLTSKKLNRSDDKRIENFNQQDAELIDSVDGIYGIKFNKPSRIDYFFFSERLRKDQLNSKFRHALRKYEEAREIQRSIDRNRGLPKRFIIQNELVDIHYSYQTKLNEMSEKEALNVLKKAAINGREGFFCLVSSEDLTLQDALKIYRQKDSIEKIFNSLKNEIQIKPLRVWSENSIYGALIIGFLAQLIISLIRFEKKEMRHTSTKFIRKSLMNLTVTVEFEKGNKRRYIYSNFDPINLAILDQNRVLV